MLNFLAYRVMPFIAWSFLIVFLLLTLVAMQGAYATPMQDKLKLDITNGCVPLEDLDAYYSEEPAWPHVILSGVDMQPTFDLAHVPAQYRDQPTRVIVATAPDGSLTKYSYEVDGCMMNVITVPNINA